MRLLKDINLIKQLKLEEFKKIKYKRDKNN